MAKLDVRAALAGSVLSSLLFCAPAWAQDATWLAAPGSADFNTSANWTPATVPTGTAFFGTSSTTSLTFSNASTSLGGFTFNAGAPAYTFTTAVGQTLTFTSGGIVNGGLANFTNNGLLNFFNTSTAGSAAITNDNQLSFNGTSTAGGSTIGNLGNLSFNNASTAASANLDNAANLTFNDTSTAGNANVNNNGNLIFNSTSTAGSATIANGAAIQFNDSSTAGSAIITNPGGIDFNNNSTAGNAHITNTNFVLFNDASTAGSATITNNAGFVFFSGSSTAGSSNIANTGVLSFSNTSSAGSATITNSNELDFAVSSTAGNARIINNGGASVFVSSNSTAGNASITNSGLLQFSNTSTAGSATITDNTGGIARFFTNSTAANAAITNIAGGVLDFFGASTAGSARITNNSGSSVDFGLSGGTDISTAGNATITNSGVTRFFASTTAGNAAITNIAGITLFADTSTASSATITNSATGQTQFTDTSTAGNATITNNLGSSTSFGGQSTAGNARLINNGPGSIFDFSASSGPLGNNQLSAGSIEGDGSFRLGLNQLTVGSNNLSTTVSGVISGNGPVALDKVGTGTLALTGTNTYTGRTLVNGGTLEVDGSIATSNMVLVGIAGTGGTLSGTGTVNRAGILSGGTLAPGSAANPFGTLTSLTNLTFQSAAFYLVQVGASASSTNVVGTASLANATVQVAVTSGVQGNKSYDILHSTNIGGSRFGSVQSLTPGFTETLSYSATDVFLNLTANLGGNLNVNQQNVATSINNAFNNGGSLPPGFLNLFNLSGASLGNALTQLSGETATASQQTTFNAMGQFMGLLTDPFMNRGGVSASSPAIGYAEEGGASAYAARSNPADAFAFVKAPLAKVYDPRWSMWVSGFGGSQSTSGNVALGSNDTRSSIFGTAVGADYLLSPMTIAGFALAGGGTNFSVANGGTGRSDLFQMGAYIRHNQGPAYISAALAYGWQDITTNRTVTVAGLDQLRAEFNANAWSGRLEGGYRYVAPWIGGIGITPYAAAQFVTFDLPAYMEQAVGGANTFALGYGAHDVTDVRSELGIRTDRSFIMPDGVLTLRGRFAWAHDYDPDRAIAATFQSLPGASFVVNGAAQASDSALTTASIEMKWRNGWSVAATFEGEFSNVTDSYAGKGVVRYQW